LNKNAYVLFTRVPVPNKVKTRLHSVLSGEEACEMQHAILLDCFVKFEDLKEQGIDLLLAYSDEGDPSQLLIDLPKAFNPFRQKGKTIGQRMDHAMTSLFTKGYEKVVLTGSDIPNLNSNTIKSAFEQMTDITFGPSPDGGYYLVGCNKHIELSRIFEKKIPWGEKDVLGETLKNLADYEVTLLPAIKDIDFPDDLKEIQHDLNDENFYFCQWLENNRGVLD